MRSTTLFLMSLFFMAPDGGGGGGGAPGSVPLEEWIKRLNGAEKKDRKTIVEEMAKALGLKTGDAYKMLNEAGWDPKNNNEKPLNSDIPPAAGEGSGHGTSALPDNTQPGSSAPAGGPAVGGNASPGSGGTPPVKAETVQVALRHKSPYPHYRRAGLLLTNQWKSCSVTAEQIAVLKKDAWVELQEPAGPNKK
jgi:hypothetical protein